MDETKPHIVLCFWCRRRVTPEEVLAGRHDHVDVEEQMAYDLAANNSGD